MAYCQSFPVSSDLLNILVQQNPLNRGSFDLISIFKSNHVKKYERDQDFGIEP